MLGRKKEKDDTPSQPYTKSTFIIQIVMSLCAIVFMAPIFMILNYSFKTKKRALSEQPHCTARKFQPG